MVTKSQAGEDPSHGLMREARRALAAGNPHQAVAIARRLAKQRARDPGALNFCGWIAHQAGDMRAAARFLEQSLALDRDQIEALSNLATLYQSEGRSADAVGLLDRALGRATLPAAVAGLHYNRGNALKALGRLDAAEQAFRAALAHQPDLPAGHGNLANTLVALGRLADAVEAYRRSLALRPGHAETLRHLAATLRKLRRFDEAAAVLRELLALDPDNAATQLAHGALLHDQGDFAAALASFDHALRLNPELALAHHDRATALRGLGQVADALAGFRAALDLAPDMVDTKIAIGGCLVELSAGPFDPRFREDLTHALREGWARPERLADPAIAALACDPGIAALIEWAERPPRDSLVALLSDPAVARALADPLLSALLEAGVVADPRLERLLTRLRGALLEAALDPDARLWPEPARDVWASLAVQCFNNDYAFVASSAEAAALGALVVAIESALAHGQPPAELGLLALACFQPLHGLPSASALLGHAWRPAVRRVLQRQIVEPREEARLRHEIPALGAIEDGVSQAVRDQYEDNPYPRWSRMPLGGTPSPLHVRLIGAFPRLQESLTDFPNRPRVLIAGCGTGWQSINAAQNYDGASVLAVDLSLTSLAYAARKTRELGIAAIEHRHADILTLGALGERFDLIEAAGVLHHMEDPLRGWRILRSLLKPHGVMRIGLYSELGRRNVMAARALIAQRGYPPTVAGIRAARVDILAAPADDLLATLTRVGDFYSLSGCRDLLFHVQEHRLTLPQIAAYLEALDLELLGFEHLHPSVARRYRAAYPQDGEMVDLEAWAAFEHANPDSFAAMYQLCLRPKQGRPA